MNGVPFMRALTGNRGNNMTRNTQRGFTLIEVMIVVAVLGVLVAIGYPSYTDQVRKSRRAEGMGELLELADRMERHYSDVGTYDQANGNDMTAAAIWKTTTTDGYYTLSVDAGTTNTSFTARATPTTKGNQNKDKCGTFVINSQGQQSLSGAASGYTRESCWH